LHWHTVCDVEAHAPPVACVCVVPSQAPQATQGAAPLALKVLPATQLPPALDTQTPPESVKPAAQLQTASELAVQAEATVCCAPLQAAQVVHG